MSQFRRYETRTAILRFLLGLAVPLLAATSAWGQVVIDATTSTDAPLASTTVSTIAFSTTSSNELLLAFISTDYLSGTNTTVTKVAGGGLTWALVVRTNSQSGSSEIWRAFAATPLSGAQVTATLSQSVVSSMTVLSFAGVDATGTNGSGAIGATGTGNSSRGAPTASLTTTRAGSWVFGVGNDYDNASSRTVGSAQTLVHQDLASVGDTYWVQSQSNPTPLAGTKVTLNDTAPSTDRYNLSIAEILPALTSGGTPTYSVSGTISPTAAGSGATVTLGGAAGASTTADASGNYSFAGLANGNYTVTPGKTGYTFNPISQTATVNGASVTGVSFTGQSTVTSWSISGTISPTTAGSGATVTLSGAASASTTADASGNYSFAGLANGNYAVTPAKSGYTFTPGSQSATVNGANLTGVSFTGQSTATTWSISGTISPTAAGSGATVTLSGAASASTTADGSGNYSFAGLANGNYTIAPSKSGYTFTPPNQSLTMAGANITSVNFTGQSSVTSWSVSGRITPSAAGNGATVTLSGPMNATTTANSTGNYTFTGVTNGSYTIAPSKSGYAFTPSSQSLTMAGANMTGMNFTGQVVVTSWSITGTITPKSAGNGATVTLSGPTNATTTANSSGNYTFTGVTNGSYTVTPSKSGYAYSPTSQSVTMNGANLTGVSFTGQTVVTSWSVSGTISPTSAGNGATVTLSGAANATTTANSSGNYTFTGVANGSYTVTPSKNGYTYTPTSQAVTMAGANVTGVSFTGVSPTFTISGTVTGLTVATTLTLSGSASATTSTDGSGNFTFNSVPNGNYTITPASPGSSFTPTSQAVTVNGANVTGISFAGSAQTYSISGTLSPSAGGGGATVTLGGASNAVTTANGSGVYSFSGLNNGSYTVTPSKSGYSFSPPNQTVVINGSSASAVNFTASTASGNNIISGSLSPAGSSVGATVTLSGPVNTSAKITGSSTFSFTGLPSGTYTVTPSRTNTTFSPLNQSITISGTDVTGVSFSASTTENIVFFDNFTTPTLSSDWTIVSRHGEYAQNETECNIPQQVSTGSGLTITTAAQAWTCGDFNIDGSVRHAPQSWPYITGDVQWTSFNFKYGTVEVRAKFPAKSTGLWPAIWMLGANCQVTNMYTADTGYSTCPGLGDNGYVETDMVECFSTYCQLNVANPSFGPCEISYSVDANWHTFTTVWTQSGTKQYEDGTLMASCSSSPTAPLFLILQTQTGGSGGTPNNSQLPAQFMIDYVKVTQ